MKFWWGSIYRLQYVYWGVYQHSYQNCSENIHSFTISTLQSFMKVVLHLIFSREGFEAQKQSCQQFTKEEYKSCRWLLHCKYTMTVTCDHFYGYNIIIVCRLHWNCGCCSWTHNNVVVFTPDTGRNSICWNSSSDIPGSTASTFNTVAKLDSMAGSGACLSMGLGAGTEGQ